MLRLIVGEKGKGKTKILLDEANTQIKTAHGSIVYLDKSTKHMYELNNRIRLIDVSSYNLKSSENFIGFIKGIISQDHDLEQVYLDSFLKIAVTDEEHVEELFRELEAIGSQYGITFVVSASIPASSVSDAFKDSVLAAL